LASSSAGLVSLLALCFACAPFNGAEGDTQADAAIEAGVLSDGPVTDAALTDAAREDSVVPTKVDYASSPHPSPLQVRCRVMTRARWISA
jgi:hypothetical protein